MKIAVCTKRVPDTAARVKIAASQVGIDHAGIEYVVSPYDEIAVEQAVRLKENGVATEVVIYCLGPAEATKEIRTCLAMGADRAVHLTGDPDAYDAGATASLLAEAIEPDTDLILFGNKAVDTDSMQVGHRVAARREVPFVNLVTGLEIADGAATMQVSTEGTTETMRAPLPLAVGVQKGLCEPRYPALKGIMKAKKKPIDTREAPADLPAQTTIVAMELPPPRPEGRIVGEGAEAVPELVRLLREEAKAL
jgi:electron transfer flavoprotein beta subunit